MGTTTNLVIKDTDKQIFDKADFLRKKHEEEKRLWALEQEKNCIYLENENEDPSNIQQQLGKFMLTPEFEKELLKILPSLKFEFHPTNPLMKALYHISGEEKKYICAYHADLLPEHSIVKVKKEIVWDPDHTQPLKRSDLPKHQWVQGKGYVFEGIPPGWKEITIPWGELKRGWRTVLLKLVKEGLMTVTQAETFGTPTSKFGQKAWSYHLGKQVGKEVAIPF